MYNNGSIFFCFPFSRLSLTLTKKCRTPLKKVKKQSQRKVKRSRRRKVKEVKEKRYTFLLSDTTPRHYLQVCSSWIGCGISRDINDVKRIQQLLVHSLDKIGASQGVGGVGDDSSTQQQQQQQIARRDYSESSYTLETLAVLKAWAQVSRSNIKAISMIFKKSQF